MTDFKRIFQAGVSSVTIAGCVALGVAVFSDSYADVSVVSASQAATKKQNFSGGFGGQCVFRRSTNGTVKGLAIENKSASSVCICPSQQAYAVYLRRNPDAAGLRCIIENDQVNQANLGGAPGDGPDPVDGDGVDGGLSGCHPCNNGWGNGGNDGVPGRSGQGSAHGPQGPSINADNTTAGGDR
jgi:hypothetical protein